MRAIPALVLAFVMFPTAALAGSRLEYSRGMGVRTLLAERCDETISPPRDTIALDFVGIRASEIEIVQGPRHRSGPFTLRVRGTADELTTAFYSTHGEDCARGVRFIRFADGTVWSSWRDADRVRDNNTLGLVSSLDQVQNATELFEYLDATEPRHWRSLSRTGRNEAANAFFELRRAQDDRVDENGLLARALRFAAVNDAIYYREDLLDVLEPELSRALGWGEREGDVHARAVADELIRMGSPRNGTFDSLASFERAYSELVDRYMTGR